MPTQEDVDSLGFIGTVIGLPDSGIYIPDDVEVDFSPDDESVLEVILGLLPSIYELQILSNSRELANLSHEEFISVEDVVHLIDEVRIGLIRLSELSNDSYLKAYYVALSFDFGSIILPSSHSEIAYGEYIVNSRLGQMAFRLGFLSDYNYERKGHQGRRDLVFNATQIASHEKIPVGFVPSLKEFFMDPFG